MSVAGNLARVGRTLACTAILCLPAAAWADEPVTGTRLGGHTQPGPALTARDQAVGAKQMATCLYNRKMPVARALLLAPTMAYGNSANAKLMGDVQCFNAQFANDMVEERRVTFPTEIMRGMLAEVALVRSAAEVAALQPLALQKIYQRDWFAVTGRNITVDEMGACIADTNPAGIFALLKTEPTSPQEGAAFGQLGDNLGKCLRAGTKLQANRQSLRAALADALFQRIYRPQPDRVTH
ncbi:MAG: hypothetical protein ABI626_01140 [Sphingomicrobium sp.]